jgi:hypothetical protein
MTMAMSASEMHGLKSKSPLSQAALLVSGVNVFPDCAADVNVHPHALHPPQPNVNGRLPVVHEIVRLSNTTGQKNQYHT